MRRLLIFLVVLAGIYGVLEVAAKVYADTKLQRDVQTSLGTDSRVEAHVSFPLLLDLLTESQVERIQVTVNDVDVGPFDAEEVNVVLHRVELDRAKSLQERSPVIEKVDSLDASVQITQAEVSRILPAGFSFLLDRDRVTLSTPAGRIAGRFEKTSAGGFSFVTQASLPKALRTPEWEFSDVALVDCFDRLEILPGKILVGCTVEDPDPDILTTASQ